LGQAGIPSGFSRLDKKLNILRHFGHPNSYIGIINHQLPGILGSRKPVEKGQNRQRKNQYFAKAAIDVKVANRLTLGHQLKNVKAASGLFPGERVGFGANRPATGAAAKGVGSPEQPPACRQRN
jgi:hypothetical protein